MTRKWLLLKLLEEAGDRGLTTAELLAAGVGSRYSARLLELRELGYGVDGERVRDGCWRYRLVFSPDEVEGSAGEPRPLEAAPVNTSAALSPADTLFDVEHQATSSHWRGEAA